MSLAHALGSNVKVFLMDYGKRVFPYGLWRTCDSLWITATLCFLMDYGNRLCAVRKLSFVKDMINAGYFWDKGKSLYKRIGHLGQILLVPDALDYIKHC